MIKDRKERVQRLDEYTLNRIVQLKRQGVCSSAIAIRLDIRPTTVNRIARLHGIGDGRRHYSEDDTLLLVEFFMDGCSNAEIAQKMNRSYISVAKKLFTLGLKRATPFVVSKKHPWHQELRQSYLNYVKTND